MNQNIVKTLVERHITKTIGCTDIGVVGFIASIGAYVLRHKKIQSIHLLMSDELYKNSVNVGVPGIKKSGLNQALALGVLLKNPQNQLSVFESVTQDDIHQIESLLKDIDVKIEHKKIENTVLYEELNMTSTEGDHVNIVIKDNYDNVVSVTKNGEKLLEFEKDALIHKMSPYKITSYDEICDFVDSGDFNELDDLFRVAELQYQSAREELKKEGKTFLAESYNHKEKSCAYELSSYLKEHIEISSRKRMIGDVFTVYGVAGSGNLGIGTFITPLFMRDAMDLTEDLSKKLVVLSFLTSVYVKQEMNVVTVLCGTGHATGCSSAVSFAYAKNASREQLKKSINLYLSSSMGFVCDGAKLSCTYKVSFAAMNGLISAQMVLDQDVSCDGLGIQKMDIDQTIRNLGKLNNEILESANKGIISLI
jgi:L-cysteine desulfidase